MMMPVATKHTSIGDLPDEVLLRAVGHLAAHERTPCHLATMATINRQFRRIATDDSLHSPFLPKFREPGCNLATTLRNRVLASPVGAGRQLVSLYLQCEPPNTWWNKEFRCDSFNSPNSPLAPYIEAAFLFRYPHSAEQFALSTWAADHDELAWHMVDSAPSNYKHISRRLASEERFVQRALQHDGTLLYACPSHIQCSPRWVAVAVLQIPWAVRYVALPLAHDFDFFCELLKKVHSNSGWTNLYRLYSSLKINIQLEPEIAMLALELSHSSGDVDSYRRESIEIAEAYLRALETRAQLDTPSTTLLPASTSVLFFALDLGIPLWRTRSRSAFLYSNIELFPQLLLNLQRAELSEEERKEIHTRASAEIREAFDWTGRPINALRHSHSPADDPGRTTPTEASNRIASSVFFTIRRPRFSRSKR